MTKAEKPHIGIFGRRNIGKSSFINAVSGQNVSIVADYPGTTTDPVNKAMELPGIGPVIFIDTAGIDDVGEMGQKRVGRTLDVIKTIDMAILLVSENTYESPERLLVEKFEEYRVPFLVVHNKSDLLRMSALTKEIIEKETLTDIIEFNAFCPDNIDEIIGLIKKHVPESSLDQPSLVGDLVSYGDIVVLVTPIDVEAPKGRLILPQVQTIRDLLDHDCITIIMKERELEAFFRTHPDLKPKLVITDSQEFLKADASVPADIPLTSFSILLARYRGAFREYIDGTPYISKLKDNDRILVLESCSHHVAGDDIGRVKIPRWITNFTGKKLHFDMVAGLSNVEREILEYSMVIQCGGCMLTRKQIYNRLKPAIDLEIPVTNYGMAIAYCLGIYKRAIEPFYKMNDSALSYL
ncbi:MAG: [FeFe] hydrogenase H-cluster maturation GTPase HydF [Calditrichaceae bacterium]